MKNEPDMSVLIRRQEEMVRDRLLAEMREVWKVDCPSTKEGEEFGLVAAEFHGLLDGRPLYYFVREKRLPATLSALTAGLAKSEDEVVNGIIDDMKTGKAAWPSGPDADGKCFEGARLYVGSIEVEIYKELDMSQVVIKATVRALPSRDLW